MITPSPTSVAEIVANQVGTAANNLVKQYGNLKANGGTFNGVTFTAAQFLTALGTTNQAILDAIVAANPQA